MAEFKLGRIRFIWKEEWSPSTTYYKDDIVRNGGNTYVCVVGHASTSDFANDLLSYWNKISDGQEWKGDWQPSTYYKANDIVKYGGYLYIANTAHTSASTINEGLEGLGTTTPGVSDDINKWDLYAEGFNYRESWTTERRYKINDIVKYNSTIYICTEAHISAETTDPETGGLELDQSKWDIFSTGLTWTGDWTTGFAYKVNDIARYGGIVYVCNTAHTSAATITDGLEANEANWDFFHKGVTYRNDWTAGIRYRINDLVKWGGGIWICTTYHTSTDSLTADEANWAQFVEGLEFEDSWNENTSYQPGDFVTYGGYSYIAVINNTAVIPTSNEAVWSLYLTGFNFRGEWGDDSSNQEYRVGDVVRVGGYTYLCIEDNIFKRPGDTENHADWTTYWERLNAGFFWKDTWTDATFYDLGDVVRFDDGSSDNSYVCVQTHTSNDLATAEGNRPDRDTSGEYWNLISGGPENNVMTTQGDLVYYGGAGPVRLPIGQAGQVLKVNSTATAPEWDYLGRTEQVYYVETNAGVDQPAPTYGLTADQPFKTIRYASEQVLKGPLRPDTRYLLEINKAFIQEELFEWVEFQILLGNGIWAGFTNDNEYLTNIEFGKIVDAIVYDITHGGNKKTREATLTYFTEAGALVAEVADENEQLVAALEQAKTLIDAVISNLAPDTTYSALNQTIDTDYTEESGSQDLIESLLDIIIASLTDENLDNLPIEIVPNVSIFVKTGQFNEILPIIVPEKTAIIGDELRSTRISPAGSLVDSADTAYSIAAIERLSDIIDNIVENDTAGWTKTTVSVQNTTHPAGSSGVAAIASDLATQIRDYINWGVNGVTGDSTEPVITGSNQPQTGTEYTYSVEVIEANREFIKDEIIAWIADTYPGYSYNETSCRRDIDRYIDAIKNDLIYTGNYKSLLAARYYVNSVNGSITEDMFYVRNATGLRNFTVTGLSGTLSAPNEFGTKRPTAGAYVSLDPGWGPDHEEVWILNKSPYVQNVTTFGDGCVGCKIDGDLHNGGNDSIVANDFTQLVSDGIGVWCTNLGRTELVSVFSYYAHIGYLAENGGKIRATNGNSSYGTFGTVAEGVDNTETPVVGKVTNRSFEAVVDSIFTDGDQMLVLEYVNAGQNYTTDTTLINEYSLNANIDDTRTVGTYTVTGSSDGSGTGQSWTVDVNENGIVTIISLVSGGVNHQPGDVITISPSEIGGTGTGFTIQILSIGNATDILLSGEGFNAEIASVNVTDGAIFEARLLDTDIDGDSTPDTGGADYFTSSNTAQEGNINTITLSNTEVALASQLFGMAIYITAGLGAGQYGRITEYNPGTKIAKISDPAVPLLEVTATDSTTNAITTTDTTYLEENMPVRFSGTEFGGLQNDVLYYVNNVLDSTSFTIGSSEAGPTVNLTTDTGSMQAYKPGWNHVLPSTPIESVLDATTTYSIEPLVVFSSPQDPPDSTYATYENTAKGRAYVEDGSIVKVTIYDPGEGYPTDVNDPNYPTIEFIDPNNTIDAPVQVRVGNGVLDQPTFADRGQAYTTASALVTGTGFMDRYQPGEFIRVDNLTEIPDAGSNLTFSSLPGSFYKLVAVRDLTGTGLNGDQPPFSAQFQVSPQISISDAPEHDTDIEMRIRFSQVRLTGHDFLDIGTGNFADTNYPNEPLYDPIPDNETREQNGGRVFYTSTDQDGNFRVGELFSVEQATGVATLNADAFNISGLQELSLGELGLGGTGATITEFSVDGTFTANSDAIVPTQKAIKTYITSQIGGGSATLNVNSITAGQVQITGQQVTTTTGNEIQILQKMNFTNGVDGYPLALNYFLGQ